MRQPTQSDIAFVNHMLNEGYGDRIEGYLMSWIPDPLRKELQDINVYSYRQINEGDYMIKDYSVIAKVFMLWNTILGEDRFAVRDHEKMLDTIKKMMREYGIQGIVVEKP